MTHSPEIVDSDMFALSIGGLRIAARRIGSGDPVLLLNGMSRPMESWAFFAGALPETEQQAEFQRVGELGGAAESPVIHIVNVQGDASEGAEGLRG